MGLTCWILKSFIYFKTNAFVCKGNEDSYIKCGDLWLTVKMSCSKTEGRNWDIAGASYWVTCQSSPPHVVTYQKVFKVVLLVVFTWTPLWLSFFVPLVSGKTFWCNEYCRIRIKFIYDNSNSWNNSTNAKKMLHVKLTSVHSANWVATSWALNTESKMFTPEISPDPKFDEELKEFQFSVLNPSP